MQGIEMSWPDLENALVERLGVDEPALPLAADGVVDRVRKDVRFPPERRRSFPFQGGPSHRNLAGNEDPRSIFRLNAELKCGRANIAQAWLMTGKKVKSPTRSINQWEV